MAPIPGRAGLHYFWEINPMFGSASVRHYPMFETVLGDLVGVRQPHFFR
jgi:hypothetical protein